MAVCSTADSIIDAKQIHAYTTCTGQFWNIPISASKVNGNSYIEVYGMGHKNYDVFQLNSTIVCGVALPGAAGDSQGASESGQSPQHSVIEGVYSQYLTGGSASDTNNRCTFSACRIL